MVLSDHQTPLEAVISGAADPHVDDVTELQEQFEEQQRDQQRLKWDQQEQTNALKEDVHYDDVMFDGLLPLFSHDYNVSMHSLYNSIAGCRAFIKVLS